MNREIDSINKELQSFLKTQEKFFGCSLKYVGADKKRFQLEIPEKHCHKIDDSDSNFSLEGQRKGFQKYYTDETKVGN